MNKFIGIDPGLDGAISLMYEDHTREATVMDMPTITVVNGKKKGREFNIPVIVNFLKQLTLEEGSVHVFLEKVHSMPKQGVASTFKFGEGYGILKGILPALDIQTTFVTPQEWKKELLSGMGKDKGSSVVRALQLMPYLILTTKRGKVLDGRGDAILIGYYGRMKYG